MYVCVFVCLCKRGLAASVKTKSPSFPGHFAGCAVAVAVAVAVAISFVVPFIAFAFAAYLPLLLLP